MYEALQTNRDIVAMLLTALAVFCAVIALAWPSLFPDVLGVRMRRLSVSSQHGGPGSPGGPLDKPKHPTKR